VKTILLIDDEPECLISFEEILKRFGYNVIAVPDGPSALSVIKQGVSLDLVITDYQIKGMNGLEVLASIRQLVPLVPSIMLTGHASIEMYLKALNLGVIEFLNKPIGAKEIGRSVKAVFEKTAMESKQADLPGKDIPVV
jgi:two-component system C4-dicarboxylate transport response regulator DctD